MGVHHSWYQSHAGAVDGPGAGDTMRAAFEVTSKLGAPFWAFHDRDIAPEGSSLKESNERLDKIVRLAKALQKDTGLKLLWGTANRFPNARFTHRPGPYPHHTPAA